MNLRFLFLALWVGSVVPASSQTNSAPFTNAAVTAAASTNSAAAVTAPVETSDQVEAKYRALLQLDDTAMTEIRDLDEKSKAQQGSVSPEYSDVAMRKMVRFKIESVKKAYQDFLREHPSHVRAMIAYGSFLGDIDEEEEGVRWWLKAQELDPKNPAVRNNLAGYYGHQGNVPLMLQEYETAIELQPTEPVYEYNLANAYYVYRKDVAALKKWSEVEVLEHSLELFKKARDLEPDNYDYAYAYAETFYGLKNPNWQKALEGWEYCLKLKITPLQRDQIYTHMARINLRMGRIAKARDYLGQIKSDQWQEMRDRLTDIANHLDAASRVGETLHPDTPKEP